MTTAGLLEHVCATWQTLTGTPLAFTPPNDLPPDSPWRVALEHDGEAFGWLSVDRPPAQFTEDQIVAWLSLSGRLLATALGERHIAAGLGDEVLAAWNQLMFLYEVLKVNATKSSPEDVAARLSQLARGVFRCENAFVAWRDARRLLWRAAEPLAVEKIENYFDLLAQDAVVVINDSAPTFLGARVPLATAGEAIIGMIGSEAGEFKARDRQLADSLAEQIGTVLDNLALQAQLTASLRVRHELEIAAQIQASLLPTHLPQPAGLALAGVIVAASQVGGDFYDVVEPAPGQLVVLTGDVAGKGIPAAMLTTLIRAELRGQALAGIAPGEALARANRALEPDLNRLETFATALVAQLDLDAMQLRFASAGHTASLWWNAAAGAAETLLSTALPLGIFPESTRAEHHRAFEPGDVLVLYSDGVTEALNAEGALFGWAGLEETLQACHAAGAEAIRDALLQATEAHRRDQPLSDDLTLLVLKRQPLTGERPLAERAFVLPVDMSRLKTLEQLVEASLGDRLAEPDQETWRHEFGLAVVEHITNLMRHAYAGQPEGKIYGLFTRSAAALTLTTLDTGAPFDPARLPTGAPRYQTWDELPEGGYGLPLIRAVMDEFTYERRAAYNQWRLSRRLPEPASTL
ncbi:MAG: SpoIIE family protein phosphatase [Anaerolineales bacterium]|nr:SpoIIE family protein phosphatase [Anaerolineales bacterium]